MNVSRYARWTITAIVMALIARIFFVMYIVTSYWALTYFVLGLAVSFLIVALFYVMRVEMEFIRDERRRESKQTKK